LEGTDSRPKNGRLRQLHLIFCSITRCILSLHPFRKQRGRSSFYACACAALGNFLFPVSTLPALASCMHARSVGMLKLALGCATALHAPGVAAGQDFGHKLRTSSSCCVRVFTCCSMYVQQSVGKKLDTQMLFLLTNQPMHGGNPASVRPPSICPPHSHFSPTLK
jgi:hypothetical protein